MKNATFFAPIALSLGLAGTPVVAQSQTQAAPKYAAKVPASVQTPNTVQTRLGPLKFFDGLPAEETVKKVYDNLDFNRGMEAFMAGIPATSVQALKLGLAEVGVAPNEGIGITESLTDARSVFLTPNTTVIYHGPSPTATRAGGDRGAARITGHDSTTRTFVFSPTWARSGPTRARAASISWCPRVTPAHCPRKATTSSSRAPTTTSSSFVRSCRTTTSPARQGRQGKDAPIYPLSAAANPPAQKFVNISGKKFNTVHANDYKFYEELNEVVQHEPADCLRPRYCRALRIDRDQEGQALCARCQDERDPHRSGGHRQCDSAHDRIRSP